jgi:hypothetical protein
MTRLIAIFLVVLVIFCAWQGYKYLDRVQKEEGQKAPTSEVRSESLAGMPYQLNDSYNAAIQKGPAATRAWLKTYGSMIQDPRKAWIQLDFCVAIARENPAEARSLFREVKERTPQSSPVWPRIKQLGRAFE